ncbi:uncharacterized protein LOC121853145 [Homarus americanus]|uniref:uncharacterized protein LOC121853145 n=1 Tax=Homarus americanus TaxID=6706 RepID=UPI001C4679CB|nr:uncharacterized protein LOC121853145 [Homarus americanus]
MYLKQSLMIGGLFFAHQITTIGAKAVKAQIEQNYCNQGHSQRQERGDIGLCNLGTLPVNGVPGPSHVQHPGPATGGGAPRDLPEAVASSEGCQAVALGALPVVLAPISSLLDSGLPGPPRSAALLELGQEQWLPRGSASDSGAHIGSPKDTGAPRVLPGTVENPGALPGTALHPGALSGMVARESRAPRAGADPRDRTKGPGGPYDMLNRRVIHSLNSAKTTANGGRPRDGSACRDPPRGCGTLGTLPVTAASQESSEGHRRIQVPFNGGGAPRGLARDDSAIRDTHRAIETVGNSEALPGALAPQGALPATSVRPGALLGMAAPSGAFPQTPALPGTLPGAVALPGVLPATTVLPGDLEGTAVPQGPLRLSDAPRDPLRDGSASMGPARVVGSPKGPARGTATPPPPKGLSEGHRHSQEPSQRQRCSQEPCQGRRRSPGLSLGQQRSQRPSQERWRPLGPCHGQRSSQGTSQGKRRPQKSNQVSPGALWQDCP